MSRWPMFQRDVALILANFLMEVLPKVGGRNWWRYYVLDQLNPLQAETVASSSFKKLTNLDLAALIRIALASSRELAVKKEAPKELTDALKALRDVRNRQAHSPADGFPIDAEISDLETTIGFIKLVDADSKLIDRIAESISALKSLPRTELSIRPDYSTISPAGRPVALVNPEPTATAKSTKNVTYLGMDFGTSTTVVSAIRGDSLLPTPVTVDQPDEYGVTTSDHLVNTVLGYVNRRLIYGREAYRKRASLHEGRNVFSSFKMKLGISSGPTYPETAVKKGALESGLVIETARDAASVFFKLLSYFVRKSIASEHLPDKTVWAVSVPASFESNQRRDLEDALKSSGLSVDAVPLIDEPNAAFLSYVYEATKAGDDLRLLGLLQSRPVNVLVYDFGAGTCDVSVLKLEVGYAGIESRNLAISRFTALGGDDIDAAIARDILLPQLCDASQVQHPSQRDIDERLIPRLQPTAELLKIRLLSGLRDNGTSKLDEVYNQTDFTVTAPDIEPFKIGKSEFHLKAPAIRLHQIADVLEPFVSFPLPRDNRTPHVFAPVKDALEKSGLSSEDLDAVLFIGGSCENTIVRECVMRGLGGDILPIVPADLRTHVSKGAALHSYLFNACGYDVIQPITSEPILVLTQGGAFETLLPASTPLPTTVVLRDSLQIAKDGQKVLEMPICVTSDEKLLHVIRIKSDGSSGFRAGDAIIITASFSRDKTLRIDAEVGGVKAEAVVSNPLANHAVTASEAELLKAKSAFNEALLKYESRVPAPEIIKYANAAQNAKEFQLAAEMYEKAEQQDASRNFSVSISYCYAMAGKAELSRTWSVRAYERQPSAVSAYNLALEFEDDDIDECIRLLRESVHLNSDFVASKAVLGRILHKAGNPEGIDLLENVCEELEGELESHEISASDCTWLMGSANLIGRTELAQRAEGRRKTLTRPIKKKRLFLEENLAASARTKIGENQS